MLIASAIHMLWAVPTLRLFDTTLFLKSRLYGMTFQLIPLVQYYFTLSLPYLKQLYLPTIHELLTIAHENV